VVLNVCLEAWSDGKAPGISPMGNPLPSGVLEHHGDLLGRHGVKRGILPHLDALAAPPARQGELDDERGHRGARAAGRQGGGGRRPRGVLSHSYAMEVVPCAALGR